MAVVNYKVGNTTNQVTVTVTVGTAGLAQSIVVFIPNTGDRSVIGQSSLSDGNIHGCNVGAANLLSNDGISIRTLIDMTGVPAADLAQAVKTVSVQYDLQGGLANASYEYDPDDIAVTSDNMHVSIVKRINFN